MTQGFVHLAVNAYGLTIFGGLAAEHLSDPEVSQSLAVKKELLPGPEP